MHLKNNNTWLKHVDFIIIDLICLMISFVVAYYLKFGDFRLFNTDSWSSLFVIVSTVNLIVTFYTNPYSGILRRRYYEQIIKEIPLLLYQVVAVCVMFYAFKIGTLFSREMMFTMYVLYFFSSHFIKYWRKGFLISKKYKFKKTRILVVGDKETIEDVIQNILVGDVIEHEISCIYLVDSEATRIKNIPVIKNYQAREIEEVFVATNPTLIPKEMYKYFIDNGICITMSIEKIFGFETENAFVQRIGNYQGLSVDIFSYDTNKIGYFFLKRCFDILFALIGMFLLIPCAVIIKLSYVLNRRF